MSDEIIPGELKALETVLGALPPRAGLNRDALMFRAGQESVRRGRWTWPLLTAASWLLVLGLGTFLAVRSPTERVIFVQEKAPESRRVAVGPLPASTPAAAPDPMAYARLREQILEHGVESMPPPPAVPLAPKGLSLSDL